MTAWFTPSPPQAPGGFSTRNLSIAAYESPAIEVIITLFMLNLLHQLCPLLPAARGKVHQALRSDELRFFLAVVAFSTLLISINIWPMYPGGRLRRAPRRVSGGLDYLHHRLRQH